MNEEQNRASAESERNDSVHKVVLPIVEERLTISKELIETGKIQIRKRVSEDEVSINIPVIHEGYEVQRKPGSPQLLLRYPHIRHEGDNIIIPVVREVIVTEKRYEVVEEIHLTKTISSVPHLQQVVLKKESVEVNRTSSKSVSSFSKPKREVMAQTVVGFFKHENEAQKAVQRLSEVGINRDQIDVSRGQGDLDSTNPGHSQSNAGKSDDNAITRFFKNLFGDSDDDAGKYATIADRGYSIVTVHASSTSDAERAADILDDCGAADVDEEYNQLGSERHTVSNIRQEDRDNDRDITVPRVEEELQVGKRTVESGGIRVRSRIVERPVEESVRLREEHVRVDRHPVNRPLSDADRNAFEDRDIELTERTEIPVVNKEARVVEEVTISKDVTERDETIRATVRNTEVDIDDVHRDSPIGHTGGGRSSENVNTRNRDNDEDEDVNLR